MDRDLEIEKLKKEWLLKAMRYCARQDRCTREVVEKLDSLDVPESYREDILERLRSDRFLDDARFAEAYVGGKFRMKRWGRLKISNGLRMKGISDELIRDALKVIPPQAYQQAAEKWVSSKLNKWSDLSELQRRRKVSAFLYSKGFEPELAGRILRGGMED